MKTLALIARRTDLTRDAFREHYENHHAPLAIETILEGTERYIRNHLREVLLGAPRFDVVSAFWYRDARAAMAIGERLAQPIGKAILADELTFMDKPANTFFAVTEHPVHGDERAGSAWQGIALIGAPDASEREAFVETYEKEALPRLLDAVDAPTWCLQHRAIAAGEPPAFDVVTQVHAASPGELVAWGEAQVARGARVTLVTVSEHESELPW